jgi:hypothetical protein
LTIVELQDDNKLLEQLVVVTSLLSSKTSQQVVNKLGTSSANTSCLQVDVGTALLQVCCNFVTTCAFLRVFTNSHKIQVSERHSNYEHNCVYKHCNPVPSVQSCFIPKHVKLTHIRTKLRF